MYIPDLFGAYIKGRELAIEKNWQDLKNYETIEGMRNSNDLQALQLLAEQADFAGKRSMHNDQVGLSSMNFDIAHTAHPGLKAMTKAKSDNAMDMAATMGHYRPEVQQLMYSQYGTNLDTLRGQIAKAAGANDYWNANKFEKAYDYGNKGAGITYDKRVADSIEAGFAPQVSRDKVTQHIRTNKINEKSDMVTAQKLDNTLDLLPSQHIYNKTNLDNSIAEAKGYGDRIAANKAGMTSAEQLQSMQTVAALMGSPNLYDHMVAKHLINQYGYGSIFGDVATPNTSGITPTGTTGSDVQSNAATTTTNTDTNAPPAVSPAAKALMGNVANSAAMIPAAGQYTNGPVAVRALNGLAPAGKGEIYFGTPRPLMGVPTYKRVQPIVDTRTGMPQVVAGY